MSQYTKKVKVEGRAQMKAVLNLLSQINDAPIYGNMSADAYIAKYHPNGNDAMIGLNCYHIASWPSSNFTALLPISFADFIVEVPSLLTDVKPIRIDGHVVEFRQDGVQVGCTFVPSQTVDDIYKRLHDAR